MHSSFKWQQLAESPPSAPMAIPLEDCLHAACLTTLRCLHFPPRGLPEALPLSCASTSPPLTPVPSGTASGRPRGRFPPATLLLRGRSSPKHPINMYRIMSSNWRGSPGVRFRCFQRPWVPAESALASFHEAHNFVSGIRVSFPSSPGKPVFEAFGT